MNYLNKSWNESTPSIVTFISANHDGTCPQNPSLPGTGELVDGVGTYTPKFFKQQNTVLILILFQLTKLLNKNIMYYINIRV